MIVNPDAQVDPLQSWNTVVCDGDFTPVYIFTTSNTDGTTTYDWTNNNPAIGLGDSGTGGIPSFLATNSSNTTITATLTVTPSYNNNGVVLSLIHI